MLDIAPLVYTRLISDDRIKDHLSGSGTTINSTKSKFPYLYFKTQGQATTSTSLQNKQCAISADFEITVFDSGSSTKARQLMFIAAEIMTEMGFILKYGPEEINQSTKSDVYRWLARFHRTYCEGDII